MSENNTIEIWDYSTTMLSITASDRISNHYMPFRNTIYAFNLPNTDREVIDLDEKYGSIEIESQFRI